MKKILLLVLAVLMIGLFTGCANATKETTGAASEDASLQAILDKGTFVLGFDQEFPPMGFKDEDGSFKGFDIDLAKEFAARLGVELVLQPIDWDTKELELEAKKIDCIWNGLTITPERLEAMSFSYPYMANRQIIVVASGSDIQTKADLAGKIVAAQTESSAMSAIRAESEVLDTFGEMVEMADYVQALTEVKLGSVDAVVIDEIMARYYVLKDADAYRVLDEHFGEEEFGVGFRKGDIALTNEFNRIFSEMKEDGTAAEISKSWFGEDILIYQ